MPKVSPRASHAQFKSREAFKVYEQEPARDYRGFNDRNVRLQQLDPVSRETVMGLLKELASETEKAQEAHRSLVDIQAELNACKEEQKRLQKDQLSYQSEIVAYERELREAREIAAHFHDIRKDLQTEQKAHEATQRKLQGYKTKQPHTQVNDTELQDLGERLAASQRELSACKDDLFRLQPIPQIPDSDISRNFDSICQQIVNWIDGELLGYEHANPHLNQKDFFLVGGNIRIARHLQKNTELGEYLTRNMIHCYLEGKLLGPNCPPLGLTRGDQELLQRAERSMAKLDPPRDAATISAWWSETLKAIARTEESQKLREKQTQAMTKDLFKSLSVIFPVVFGDLESMKRFHVQVMQPASKFAITLQGSCSNYWFGITEYLLQDFRPLTTDMIKDYRMIDFKTRMPLKPNTGVVADKNGVFGKCIIQLEPQLYRINTGKEPYVLRQGVYLVELDHPITKCK